jgi:ribosomal protein L11 methyltransferase
MKWIEIVVKTTEEAYDAISDMLTTMGAGGVVIEDPNDIRREIEKPDSLDYADEAFIKTLGQDVVIKAYFSSNRDNIKELIRLIKEKILLISNFLDIGEGYMGYSEIDDEDWATGWKKHYKPFHLTDRIVIKPSWENYNENSGEIVIELDPGMAFGTGTHETTKMCSRLLEKYMQPGYSVVDVGCGTGILSIIAAKLGAKHVTALDVDEVAVRITGENCGMNGTVENVSWRKGVLDDLDKNKVDIIVANIIADVIIAFSTSMPEYLKAGGLFITSGIIKERKDEVLRAYTERGFELMDAEELGEWVAMVFKCQNSL